MVTALASHQCGLGSNPGVNAVGWVCCWFSPLLWEVFLRVLRFPPLLKIQHFQIPIRPEIRSTKNHFVDVLPPNHIIIIINNGNNKPENFVTYFTRHITLDNNNEYVIGWIELSPWVLLGLMWMHHTIIS